MLIKVMIKMIMNIIDKIIQFIGKSCGIKKHFWLVIKE